MNDLIKLVNDNQGVVAIILALVGGFGSYLFTRRKPNLLSKIGISKFNKTLAVGRDIQVRRDLVINSDNPNKEHDQPSLQFQEEWLAEVIGPKPVKYNLPIRAKDSTELGCFINVIDKGSGRWRAGFIFESYSGKVEYIFHASQNENDPTFRVRIVERIPGIKEVDERNRIMGVRNPAMFCLSIKKENNEFSFFIDGAFAGKYSVPVEDIGNVILAAWSDDQPIKVLFKGIRY